MSRVTRTTRKEARAGLYISALLMIEIGASLPLLLQSPKILSRAFAFSLQNFLGLSTTETTAYLCSRTTLVANPMAISKTEVIMVLRELRPCGVSLAKAHRAGAVMLGRDACSSAQSNFEVGTMATISMTRRPHMATNLQSLSLLCRYR